MLFGMTAVPVGPKGQSDADLYAKSIRDVEMAVRLGFDSVWTLEHHFTPYFPQPDVLLYLAHVAAKYPRLGLGTAVLVLPWYHPVRLTEQIAMLNILSSGRLYLGLGRGTARYEFDRLGVDMTETRGRFQECVEIMRLGLAGRPFTYEGEYYRLPETQIRPIAAAPDRIQFFGAIGSPASVEIMADLALPPIQTTNFPDHMAEGFVRTWKQLAADRGMSTENLGLPILANPTIVRESEDEARDLGRKFYPIFAREQMEHYETAADYWKDLPSYESFSKMFAKLGRLAEQGKELEAFLDNQLVGSPDRVAGRIETFRDRFAIGHVICGFAAYGMDQETSRKSAELFAGRIMPRFRKQAKAG
ncbi:MAG: LLM class flavin-dependent oxidoreductase [SAR324 cluster bacterium]|nr:LLM class flavin-dependent oxidoreductase [SAR324 cluster bacterium]